MRSVTVLSFATCLFFCSPSRAAEALPDTSEPISTKATGAENADNQAGSSETSEGNGAAAVAETVSPEDDDASGATPAGAAEEAPAVQRSASTSSTTAETAGPDAADQPVRVKKKPADFDASALSSEESGRAEDAAHKKKKKKKFEIKTRIHVRWELEPEDVLVSVDSDNDNDTSDGRVMTRQMRNRFVLRRARLKIEWKPEKRIFGKLQVGEFHNQELNPRDLLKDAFIHVSPLQYLEVRVGQFKKPFSRLELRSSGKLRIAERGEGNDFIVGDLFYGGRDVGVQLSGRLLRSVKLDYEMGVFRGLVTNQNANDVVGRLKITPLKWFEMGAGGSFKFFDDSIHEDRNETFAWAAGVDTVWRAGDARLHLEGLVAQDHRYGSRYTDTAVELDQMPLAFSVIGILSYRHEFDTETRLAVEPVFMTEMLDPNLDFINDQMIMFGPGFNTYIGKYLRVMLYSEIRRGGNNRIASFSDHEVLMLQLCLDI